MAIYMQFRVKVHVMLCVQVVVINMAKLEHILYCHFINFSFISKICSGASASNFLGKSTYCDDC